MRIGLGCLRFGDATDTVTAALEAGAAVFDTARAYGNEAVVAERLAGRGFVVTKCGMTQPGWVPDGRARTLLADAEASVAALGRVPDLLLLHAPDPAVDLAVSARALARAKEHGLARAVGLCNVTRGQLEAVASEMPIAAVQIALGPYDDAAARGGVVAWCKANAARLLVHSPLGGPRRVAKLRQDTTIGAVAAKHGRTAAEIMLAYLLALDPIVEPLVGARGPAAFRSAASAEAITLEPDDLARLDARFPGLALLRTPLAPPPSPSAEVVLLMGVPGAGKSRLARGYVARGYVRLNRDELGGTLKGIAQRLGAALAAGETRLVLDNTYLGRAVRSDVLRVAHAANAAVRCVHVDISLEDAQTNLASRLLERHGALVAGRELAALARKDAGTFMPTVLSRVFRQLEPPAPDEGFASIERVPFARDRAPGVAALVVPLDHVGSPRVASHPEGAPLLVFGWNAPGARTIAERAIARPFDLAICEHGDGPPTCWCRPPLPGLVLAFARTRGVDLGASALLATSPLHRRLGLSLGMTLAEP